MTTIPTIKSFQDKRVALAKAFARRISEKDWQPRPLQPGRERSEGQTASTVDARFPQVSPGVALARAAA